MSEDAEREQGENEETPEAEAEHPEAAADEAPAEEQPAAEEPAADEQAEAPAAEEETETLFLSSANLRAFVREQPNSALALIGRVMAERTALRSFGISHFIVARKRAPQIGAVTS